MRVKNCLNNSLCLIVLFSIFISCKKDKNNTPAKEPEFYYVGYSYNQSYQETNRRAILSIGDSIVQLSPNNRSDATAIYVHNNDVHVTGYQHGGTDKKRVVYWRNGTITHLSDAFEYNKGTAVFADDANVYVAGTVYEIFNYNGEDRNVPYQYVWINGAFKQKYGAVEFSGINYFAPYNGKLYMAGQFAQRATLWNENYVQALSSNASGADYIKVINGDTYVIGWEGIDKETDAFSVWKNKEKVFSNTLGKRTSSVVTAMDGWDYYYAANSGATTFTASVYKNDQLLYNLAEGSNVKVEAIQVYNKKVYVLGQLLNGTQSIPTLWEDGVPKTLFPSDKKIYLHDFVIR
ncbi:hypothetical protein [Pseudopedobacter sp.]|uniref:hypothetical protein n=1 Tax=Pseudopedobacter sp. TaxID=1936787 RepID=UPI0033414EA0